MLRLLCAVSTLSLLVACGKPSEPAVSESASADRRSMTEATSEAQVSFDEVVDNASRIFFDEIPESATAFGASDDLAPGAGSHLIRRSIEAETRRRARMEEALQMIESVDPETLSPGDQRIRSSMITVLDGAIAPGRIVDYGGIFSAYGVWYLPYIFTQNSGVLVEFPNLMESQHAVTNADQADAYIARLDEADEVLEEALEKFKADVAAGAIPPDFIIAKTRAVADNFAKGGAKENILYTSFVKKLSDANVDGAGEYEARTLALIGDEVLPAYKAVSDYLTQLEEQAPHDAGAWRLPNGSALYEAMIRHMTDENMSADELHQTGLDEVERITAEMDVLFREVGYTEGTVGERFAQMSKEDRFVYPNDADGKAAILDDIQTLLDEVNRVVPQWFGILPKHGVEVRAVPEFSQDSAPGGYYAPPPADGSRPGTYWINLKDTAAWPHFTVPTLTYHEAVPGHHFQAAIAIDQDAPLIGNVVYSNSSAEGWALYTEALAKEMGLYADDPYGDIGRLQAELHRAVRLVVDTGMHAKKWSREQAIQYMMDVEGAGEADAVSEIERYVVWPGQALGYKVGMLRIQELRAEAEATLGDDFDIREFHDEILKVSSFALPVIDAHVRAWIDAKAND